MRAHVYGDRKDSFEHQEKAYIFRHFYYLMLKKQKIEKSLNSVHEFKNEMEVIFNQPNFNVQLERPEVFFILFIICFVKF